jgi:hypothetical protein
MSIKDTERVAGQILAIHRAEFGRLSDIIAAKDAEIARLREGLGVLANPAHWADCCPDCQYPLFVFDYPPNKETENPADFARKLLEDRP